MTRIIRTLLTDRDRAGKVWLLVPDDEGVFLETLNAQGLPPATAGDHQ